MTDARTSKRLEKMADELKQMFPDPTQRMLHELRLFHGMKDENIGHIVDASRVSIGNWRIKGVRPNEDHAARIADLYMKMEFLKGEGITYKSFKDKKTVDQAYEEAKKKKGKAA